MSRIFGFDIGTTSIGFAVIDHDPDKGAGNIVRMGVRIFPEARDPDGTPLNQQRRQKRMVRRQLRRRRVRRKLLNETLHAAGLLPAFGSTDWLPVMAQEPYGLRKRALEERLDEYQVGRAIYHLSKRRHFRGRDLEEEDTATELPDEKEAKTNRESTLQALNSENITLGTWLSGRSPHDRKRGVHASRSVVQDEFEELWESQARHHAVMQKEGFKEEIKDAIFSQRPVFWRKNTLGECRFMPGEPLCPKGSWLSQQKRMLEMLNNLSLAGGNMRQLDDEERGVILERLQIQASMSWGGVRKALKPLMKERGEAGAEKGMKFNLELGGETKLMGNAIEAKLANVFKDRWAEHPHKQAIRDAAHQRLWEADYGEVGTQRVVIRSARERKERRSKAGQAFIEEFSVTPEEASALQEISLPTGWEPYSTRALEEILPELEAGIRFGALVSSPEYAGWRDDVFPNRDQATGEILDRLPSPASREEQDRIRKLRNPTVVRAQNELRKVVNNLIDTFGKPDLIRIEVARDVGKSKRERSEMLSGMRKQERRRNEAARELESNGITDPSRDDVEKWLLWKESGDRCPYSGDQIGFNELFRDGLYEVEHIWPRSRSFDNSFRNKTLCRRDINLEKGNRTPYEAFHHDEDRWAGIQMRLQEMTSVRSGSGMSPGKVKRFLAREMPDDFAARQLNDTGYAARQAVGLLKRLWPDIGPEAPVTVQAVTGRVTAQLRRLWSLNNILADDGEKTRADHRHHAVDALTIACTHPGMTQRLGRYWQAYDDPGTTRPTLQPPWASIRDDAEKSVGEIVVSHRVRKKISGPLHKETTYGDTRRDVTTATGNYRQFVTRKNVESLTRSEISKEPDTTGEGIRDARVRSILQNWVTEHGGDPKKAFPPYPRLGETGPEIRRIRLLTKQQLNLMAPYSTGYADLGNNHHIAIFRATDGKVVFDVVSLHEAAQRLTRRENVVRRHRDDGAKFVMSLAPGETVEFPEGDYKGFWVVSSVWSVGQIVLETVIDAGRDSTYRPTASSLLKSDGRKVSVDPIGRVRIAND